MVMSGEALAQVPEHPSRGRTRRGWSVFGVVVALAFSAALVWWLVAPDISPAPAVVVHSAVKTAVYAPANADPAQVQRAFAAVQDAYADGGADGLARTDADCAAALKDDARVLDYCLAFDLFATAVAPEIGRADASAARLEAARAALPPGLDPAARLAQVRVLMRQASLGAGFEPPRIAAAQRAPIPRPAVRLAQAPASPSHASPPHASAPHVASRAAEQRREAARAAVRALFARAEAAHDAAGAADAIARIYAERTRPPLDETAPH